MDHVNENYGIERLIVRKLESYFELMRREYGDETFDACFAAFAAHFLKDWVTDIVGQSSSEIIKEIFGSLHDAH